MVLADVLGDCISATSVTRVGPAANSVEIVLTNLAVVESGFRIIEPVLVVLLLAAIEPSGVVQPRDVVSVSMVRCVTWAFNSFLD